MKYIVLVCDGMADHPVAELDGRTPLEAAKTPNMDFIAKHGIVGRVKTIPDKAVPGSDVANINILGYNPKEYYTGRGPLEAVNLGVTLEEGDVAFRCNLVTVMNDKMSDYSAGHISSKEGKTLMHFVDEHLGNARIKFYPGISYRNLLVIKKGADDLLDEVQCRPPHDISGQDINRHLPQGKRADILLKLMQDSRKILTKHEINQVRLDLKENPANMIWLWGQGKKPSMPTFKEKYGLSGSVISAVDLIKGLGIILGLDVINVPGATGYYDTDYLGKANAAVKSLKDKDFVFVHLEAADEAGHNGDLREKILAIERFDQMVVGTLLKAFHEGQNFRILVLPDHATPVALKTHTSDVVPFEMYGKDIDAKGFAGYNESQALKSELYFDKAFDLMNYLINLK